MKKIPIYILVVIVAISTFDIIRSKRGVNRIIEQVDVGMAKSDVIGKCGPPTGSGQMGYPEAVGTYVEYAFPNWWDYLLWMLKGRKPYTVEGSPSIPGAARCTIEFQEQNGTPVVVTVTRTSTYSDVSAIIKGRPILDNMTESESNKGLLRTGDPRTDRQSAEP